MPAVVVEVLRFCVVVFFAGLGFVVGDTLADDGSVRVGPLQTAGVGVLLGAAIGYVLGGVVARLTARSLAAAEEVLNDRSAEQILAGMAGAVLGVLLAGGVTWPLLLIGSPLITVPLFVFVVIVAGTLGYRLGVMRREAVLNVISARTGLSALPQTSSLPRLLDSSVAVDGRVLDVVRAGFLHGTLLVPEPVLAELQGLADAGDDTRRGRGRRGLETLAALRRERAVDVEVVPDEAPEVPEVDAKLVRMALDRGAPLLTLDTTLAKVAALSGVRVMNLHALALALRPPVVAGEVVPVLLLKPGKEAGQAVGYLDDGTMVVAEGSRASLGSEVRVVVTSVLTTANGRMVFGRREQPAEVAP